MQSVPSCQTAGSRFVIPIRHLSCRVEGTLPVGLVAALLEMFAFRDNRCNPRVGENEPCVSQQQRTSLVVALWAPWAWSL